MPTQYSRKLSDAAIRSWPSLLDDTREQVRAHLSIVTTADDDETTHADEVDVWEERLGDGVLVCGSIDRDPVAAYLTDSFDPEAEAAANPLSVPSEFGEPSTDPGERS